MDTKSGAGGGPIDILLPRLCSGDFCPELTVRPLAEIEVSILRSLVEQPAPSRQALADRLGIPLAELHPLGATFPLDNRLPVYLQRWGVEADESIDYLLLTHPATARGSRSPSR